MKVIGASGFLIVLAIVVSCIGIVFGKSLSGPKTTAGNLENLRKLMNETSIQAYLIPSNDAHQSEYVGKSDARLTFMSGFTGSTGFGIVTLDEAAIWIDSRYHLQAEQQVDQSHWTVMKMGVTGVQSKAEWLLAVLGKNSTIGFDALLLSSTEISALSGSMTDNGHKLVPVQKNLIDAVWVEKPAPNITPLRPHTLEYTGRRVIDKIDVIRKELKKEHAVAIFLTALDDIACKKFFHF